MDTPDKRPLVNEGDTVTSVGCILGVISAIVVIMIILAIWEFFNNGDFHLMSGGMG